MNIMKSLEVKRKSAVFIKGYVEGTKVSFQIKSGIIPVLITGPSLKNINADVRVIVPSEIWDQKNKYPFSKD